MSPKIPSHERVSALLKRVAPTPERRAAIAICGLLALAFSMPLWVTSGSVYTLSFFCPADTLVVGSLATGDLLLGGASFLAMFGLLGVTCLFFPAAKRPRPADILLARRRRIAAIVGGCLVVIAIPMAVYGFSSFYCARPQGIFVYGKPFGAARIYAWTDVSEIATGCFRKRLWKVWSYFDVVMKDGQTFALGEDALIRNYRGVSDALRDVPFVYDNSKTADCTRSLRQFFATRPGAHVD